MWPGCGRFAAGLARAWICGSMRTKPGMPTELRDKIEPLLQFGISCVEQPVPHAEVGRLAELRQQIGVPVMLDESLTSMADAQAAIAGRTCDLFNIRLSKCGGFLASLRLAALAHDGRAGLSAWLPSGRVGHPLGRGPALGVQRRRHSLPRRLVRSPPVPPAADQRGHHVRLRRPGAGPRPAGAGRDDQRGGAATSHGTQQRVSQSRRRDRVSCSTGSVASSRATSRARDPTDSCSPLLRAIGCYACCSNARASRPELISITPPTAGGWPCACGTPWNRRGPASFFCTASPATAAGTTAVAEHLAAAGFDVHFLDRRGSGLNAEQPGDVDHWQTWIDDVAVYLGAAIANDAADRAVRHQLGRQAGRGRGAAASGIVARPGPDLSRPVFAVTSRGCSSDGPGRAGAEAARSSGV